MEPITQLNQALSDRYRVERELGVGGMATVFVAMDVRHGRRVALKVIKPELAAVLGVERFLAEIRVMASLQHPNLVPLFDSGDAGGLPFFVMPLIEGESLRARLDRERQLPVDDAVRIAGAVASALDYAHAHRVVHRDLKPENILLHAGEPLVTDFGIALAVSVAGGQRITQTGLSLGTPQYMSPEQATGDRHIDARSDIYSLGAVLFEMLTGEPPHLGNTVQAIIARVVAERPRSVRALRTSVPENIAYAVDRALEKVPADRWQSGRAFADALRASVPPGHSSPDVRSQQTMSWRGRARDPLTATLAVLAAGAIAAAAIVATRRPPEGPEMQLSIPTSGAATLETSALAISRDGQTIAYLGRGNQARQIFVRRLNEPVPKAIEGSDYGLWPAFSPDGKWIAFFAADRHKIFRVSVDGGPLTEVANVPRSGRMDWTRSDLLVFSSNGSLASVPASGGPVVTIAAADSGANGARHQVPLVLDDGESIIYTDIGLSGITDAKLWMTDRRGGRRTPLGITGVLALGMIDGHLIYARSDGTLMAVPFDRRARRSTGPAIALRKNVGNSGVLVMAALADNGTLVYGRVPREAELLWVDEHGSARPVVKDRADYFLPRVSPDGKRIVVFVSNPVGSRSIGSFLVIDIATGAASHLSPDSTGYYPEWTADSRAVMYVRGKDSSVVRQPADGSGGASIVLKDTAAFHYFAVHPNGREILFTVFPQRQSDGGVLYMRAIDDGGPPRRLDAFPGGEWAYRVSPNGKWLAYSSSESGSDEVYVRPFPGPGPRTQISQGGGTEPVWSPDGSRIYYRDSPGRAFFMAKVRSTPDFAVLSRTKLFEGGYGFEWDFASYDVSRSNELLLTRYTKEENELYVAVNWRREVREQLQQLR